MGCVSSILPGYTRAEKRGIGASSRLANRTTGRRQKNRTMALGSMQRGLSRERLTRRRMAAGQLQILRNLCDVHLQPCLRSASHPELLPEWLSNVHPTAGGEQCYSPNLFRSGDPAQDDGKTMEKMSLEAPTKMAKNPRNARDGEGQSQANTMAFDRIPPTTLEGTYEGRRGRHSDEVQSQTDSDTVTFLKTAPKAPRKMLEAKALREEMTYGKRTAREWFHDTNSVLAAPGRHDLSNSSTSRTSATDLQTQPGLDVPLATKLENSSGYHGYTGKLYSERYLEKLREVS
jgi:hypothetical protein